MPRKIDYGRLMHRAMRGLIQEVLSDVAAHGLPGEHHFFITFDTTEEGVDVADWLRERYPDEMTIVIQNWYDGLEVRDDGFSIVLNFGDSPEALDPHLRRPVGRIRPALRKPRGRGRRRRRHGPNGRRQRRGGRRRQGRRRDRPPRQLPEVASGRRAAGERPQPAKRRDQQPHRRGQRHWRDRPEPEFGACAL